MSDLIGEIARYLQSQATALGELMKINDLDSIYQLTNQNALVFAKVLLAHGRRLDRYFMFLLKEESRNPKSLRLARSAEEHRTSPITRSDGVVTIRESVRPNVLTGP